MPADPTSSDPDPSQAVPDDPFLSGAYRRILRTSIVLSVTASIIAAVMNRHTGVGVAVGSLIACLNFMWLNQGAELLVRRVLPGSEKPSRFWIIQSFPVRYFVVLAAAYVILKSYPGMRVGFIVGLVLPILAMMSEGAYEALFSPKKTQSPKL